MQQGADGVYRVADSVKQSSGTMKSSMSGLRDVISELSSKFGQLRSTAVDAFSRLMTASRQASDALTQNAGHMRTELDTIRKGFDFTQLQFAGQTLQDFGQRVTGFFGTAIKSAASFDQNITNTAASLNSNFPSAVGMSKKAIDDLTKSMGGIYQNGKIQLSTQEIADMNAEAIKLGKSGFFSATQVSDSMNTLAKQGSFYKQIMGGAIQTVSQVAAANQEDINQTANVVSDVVHQMGGELRNEFGPSMTKQFQGIGDAMTSAMHHGRLSMKDFLNSMKYFGPQASNMGLSIKDLSAGIALFADHGIKGSQAGTGFRRMLLNLNPTTAKAQAEMQNLGLVTASGATVFFDAAGKMKPLAEVQKILYDHTKNLTPVMRQAAIQTIFGTYALSGMQAFAQELPTSFQSLQKAMGKTGVTNEILAEKSKGLGLQLQALKAHYDTLQKQIGEALKPVLEVLVGLLNRLMNAWNKIPAPMQKNIILFASIAGVVALVGGAILTAVGTFGMLTTAAVDLIPALGAISVPFLPLIAIIAAVVAAVAALHYAWKHNLGGIQQKTKVALDWITKQFDAAMKYVGKYVAEGIKAVVDWWHKMAPTFEKAIHNIWAAIVWLEPLWKALWAIIKFVVKEVFDTIVFVIKAAWKIVSGIFQFFGDLLAGNWKKLWGDLWQVIVGAVKLIIGLFELGFVGKGITLLAKLLSHFDIFGKLLSAAFKGLAKLLEDASKVLWKILSDLWKGGVQAVSAIFGGGFKVIRDVFTAFSKLFHGDIKGFWSALKTAFMDGVKAIGDLIAGLFRMFDTVFGGLPMKALAWGENMITMFIHGIESKIAGIVNAVKKVANAVKSFLGFHSPTEKGPLADSAEYMPNMMKMYNDGISSSLPKLRDTLGGVALTLQNTFAPNPNAISSNVRNQTSIVNQYAKTAAPMVNGSRGPVNITIQVDGNGKHSRQLGAELAQVIRTQMAVVSA
jgi:TP901 family phage tail tape measure protein